MAEIHHELKIKAHPERVFEALTTAQGLRSWHSAHVEAEGAPGPVWRFVHTDRPTFRWQVTECSAPLAVAWRCLEGPGDSVGTVVSFHLSKTDEGRTLVELAHAGWPGTHGNFRKCNTYWGVLLHHLRQYVETGTPDPARMESILGS
jgi:uncharacterized protein YndB with AHSA1/START domain